jgi:hypothetical protein
MYPKLKNICTEHSEHNVLKVFQSLQPTLFVSETLQESQITVVDSLQTIALPTHWHSFITEREGSETKGWLAVFICNQSHDCP